MRTRRSTSARFVQKRQYLFLLRTSLNPLRPQLTATHLGRRAHCEIIIYTANCLQAECVSFVEIRIPKFTHVFIFLMFCWHTLLASLLILRRNFDRVYFAEGGVVDTLCSFSWRSSPQTRRALWFGGAIVLIQTSRSIHGASVG